MAYAPKYQPDHELGELEEFEGYSSTDSNEWEYSEDDELDTLDNDLLLEQSQKYRRQHRDGKEGMDSDDEVEYLIAKQQQARRGKQRQYNPDTNSFSDSLVVLVAWTLVVVGVLQVGNIDETLRLILRTMLTIAAIPMSLMIFIALYDVYFGTGAKIATERKFD